MASQIWVFITRRSQQPLAAAPSPQGPAGTRRGSGERCSRVAPGSEGPSAAGPVRARGACAGHPRCAPGPGEDPGEPSPRVTECLVLLPPQTMDPHGGRRPCARPPSEDPSPPAC
ncbi:hypothetical protein VULLAG_LOCUS1812 [Vulpes lagopus]